MCGAQVTAVEVAEADSGLTARLAAEVARLTGENALKDAEIARLTRENADLATRIARQRAR